MFLQSLRTLFFLFNCFYVFFYQKESENVYYFVTDIPSCLYAIREAYDSGMNIMSRDDVFEARNNFVQTVKDLLTHPHYHSEFENQCELLLWPDNDDGNLYSY